MRFLLVTVAMMVLTDINAQDHIIKLWEDGIPNSRNSTEKEVVEKTDIIRISKVQEPSIEVYLPSKRTATGQAVVICPGGGYGFLAYDWEGIDIAKWLNSLGIAGVVLKYRLPDSKSNDVRHLSPLIDAQRAIRLVRYHAKSWNIDSEQVGVMGFSAGGHLASTLGTAFDKKLVDSSDLINLINARPDFMLLIYPVISMNIQTTHQGSRNNLLGPSPGNELIKQFSNDQQVSQRTPPTFIVHSGDDEAVPVENSLLFYKALLANDIPVEMHIFPEGGHGYSLAQDNPSLNAWTRLAGDWLKQRQNADE